ACAVHWWHAYVDATDPETAYAAWVLFLACADRRAHISMSRRPISDDAPLPILKRAHIAANRRRLERAMTKREQSIERRFLRRDVVRGIGPWVKGVFGKEEQGAGRLVICGAVAGPGTALCGRIRDSRSQRGQF